MIFTNEAGELHREDGPAIMLSNGHKEWWFNGKLHRLDGPAITWDGGETWAINGCKVDIEIKQWAKERDVDLNNLSNLDKFAIEVEWGNYKAA